LPVPSGSWFCSTIRIPRRPGLVKTVPSVFDNFCWCMSCSHLPAADSRLQAGNPASPTRFSESRKHSVPVRVHSIPKSSGSAAPVARPPPSNPFLTHGTVESPAKYLSPQCHFAAKSKGVRSPPIKPTGSRPTPTLAGDRPPKIQVLIVSLPVAQTSV
jgi:hypothetical protein